MDIWMTVFYAHSMGRLYVLSIVEKWYYNINIWHDHQHYSWRISVRSFVDLKVICNVINVIKFAYIFPSSCLFRPVYLAGGCLVSFVWLFVSTQKCKIDHCGNSNLCGRTKKANKCTWRTILCMNSHWFYLRCPSRYFQYTRVITDYISIVCVVESSWPMAMVEWTHCFCANTLHLSNILWTASLFFVDKYCSKKNASVESIE